MILNHVASAADGPEHIAFGTAKGPTRLGPLAFAVSAAATMALVEGPPSPAMIPVRSWLTSASDTPASAIASSQAMFA